MEHRSALHPSRNIDPAPRSAFSLVELLVVIGIIALLMSLLLPAMVTVRRHANSTVCKSNLHQCGLLLLAYANESKGRLFPEGWGSDKPRESRWPVYVFRPPMWNPPVMRCPDDLQPREDHSYILNAHLSEKKIRYGQRPGIPFDRAVWMGEKVSNCDDYYMENTEHGSDFFGIVEEYRHGVSLGSNYLYLDLHVSSTPPETPRGGVDPWDVPGGDPQAIQPAAPGD